MAAKDQRTSTDLPMPASVAQQGLPLTLVVAIVALRTGLANLAPISDCDEVYNYWEPLHFLLYGSGMQTWEYAPQYALRTYIYLVPMSLIAKAYASILGLLPSSMIGLLMHSLSLDGGVGNKVIQFNMLRSTLAAMTALSEINLHHAISTTISTSVANWALVASLTSAGFFHAAPAYLPSAHVMSCWMCSVSAQMRGNDREAIILGLIAVLGFGWPFSAVLFLSTGICAVWRAAYQETTSDASRKPDISAVFRLLLRTASHATIIQVIVLVVDYQHYGNIVSPIFNIFVYNTKGQGDELYGIEPLSYYVKNLFLNLNFVSVLGVFALPVVVLKSLLIRQQQKSEVDSVFSNKILLLVPMYIWLLIVFPRPHKEERFLFPIYPMLCAGAGLVVDEIASLPGYLMQKIVSPISGSKRLVIKRAVSYAVLAAVVLISVSRSVALVSNYSSPLKVYGHLHGIISASGQNDSNELVCVGGEWYRYPSSFYLPPNTELGFLKSSFGGQLPQPFTKYGSRMESLSIQKGNFNDVNEEEMDRYVDIKTCTLLVELMDENTEPSFQKVAQVPEGLQLINDDGIDKWEEVLRLAYLDVDATPALHRIFYIPFLRNSKAKFKAYTIYRRIGR